MKTLVLKTDGTQETLEHEAKLSLEKMQELVGGYIQLTTCEYNGRRLHMLVDEDGRPRGLPKNLQASHLFRGAGEIVGTAIVLLDWKLS